MKYTVFSAWGECVDVGINFEFTEGEARYEGMGQVAFISMSAAEARKMAAELLASAQVAEDDERSAQEYFANLDRDGTCADGYTYKRRCDATAVAEDRNSYFRWLEDGKPGEFPEDGVYPPFTSTGEVTKEEP